jgi:Ankyrin repeats (3 copies)
MILPLAKLTTINVQTVVRTMSNVGLIDMIVKHTAPSQAAMYADKHMKIINILFNAGADIEAMDNLENRPLHFAAISPSVETVKLFLELGADPTAVNSKGHTPLECAAMENPNCTVFQVMWFPTISKPLHLELKVLARAKRAWLEMMHSVLCEANVR